MVVPTDPASEAPGKTPAPGPRPDWAASLTLALVAALALGAAWMLPWWVMNARAPQYGFGAVVDSRRKRLVAAGPHPAAACPRPNSLRFA